MVSLMRLQIRECALFSLTRLVYNHSFHVESNKNINAVNIFVFFLQTSIYIKVIRIGRHFGCADRQLKVKFADTRYHPPKTITTERKLANVCECPRTYYSTERDPDSRLHVFPLSMATIRKTKEKKSCQKPLDRFQYNLAKMFLW